QSEVEAALHDVLLQKHPEGLSPSEAYDILGKAFHLSQAMRSLRLPRGNEPHWDNRVRQARRHLVEHGIFDNSEAGLWKLTEREEPRWWIEKTIVEGRQDRQSGENALGKALWSPLRSRSGQDIYASMRLIEPSDRVIHLIDEGVIVGVSLAANRADLSF